eukprot:gene7929-biopygen1276
MHSAWCCTPASTASLHMPDCQHSLPAVWLPALHAASITPACSCLQCCCQHQALCAATLLPCQHTASLLICQPECIDMAACIALCICTGLVCSGAGLPTEMQSRGFKQTSHHQCQHAHLSPSSPRQLGGQDESTLRTTSFAEQLWAEGTHPDPQAKQLWASVACHQPWSLVTWFCMPGHAVHWPCPYAAF